MCEDCVWFPHALRLCFSIESQLEVEAEVMRSSQRELLSVDDTVYMPDHDRVPVNRALIQKAGYLNIRKYGSLDLGQMCWSVQVRCSLTHWALCPAVRRGWWPRRGTGCSSSRRGGTWCVSRGARWPAGWFWIWTTVLSWPWSVRTGDTASRSRHPTAKRAETVFVCLNLWSVCV